MADSIFITGGTGATGQALLRLLAADEAFRGVPITCLCRPGGRGERLLPFGVKIAGGDASSAGSLRKVYQGQPVVIHISSIFHTGAVLEGCAGMKRLIAVSSTRVYSRTWDKAKEIEETERVIARSGVPFTILRPTIIYGVPGYRLFRLFIGAIRRSPVLLLPGGASMFQPVHVDDVASCIVAALKSPASLGRSYNVPGESAHTLREMVNIVSGILGKSTLVVPVPLALAEAAAALNDKTLRHPALTLEMMRRLREDKRCDYSETTKDLGYSPRSFTEGIKQQIWSMGLISPDRR
ncbi:MAG: NAD(P)H-binding protein [Candidatus Krumholzibacteriaceae bacterium]|jgi:uncharacterized protein YbjT (DUF2867 family)